MSWTEIPGGMVTNLPVVATVDRDGELYVFATETDQRIYFNRQAGEEWAGWTPFLELCKRSSPLRPLVTFRAVSSCFIPA
jgi:hypothetical protein